MSSFLSYGDVNHSLINIDHHRNVKNPAEAGFFMGLCYDTIGFRRAASLLPR